MKCIIIEGNIGVGKSTLTKQLADHYKGRAFYEPVNSNPYLVKYYKDPKQYALPMQFYLMSNRFAQHQDGIEHIWKTHQSCFYDRSIYGDYVFAKRNWLDGNMSDLDFENYNKMRAVMFKNLMVPHVTIYLKNTPEVSHRNILNRSRGFEESIPLEYLRGLDSLYKELIYEMKELGSEVIELDWNEFPSFDYVKERLKGVL
jgi:deoxyadenosine/deoxycytidine kinase